MSGSTGDAPVLEGEHRLGEGMRRGVFCLGLVPVATGLTLREAMWMQCCLIHSRLYVLKKYHVRREHCKTAVHGNQKQHHKHAGQKKLFNFSFTVFKPCAECKRRKTHGNCTNEPWQTCTFNTECID